MKKILLIPGLVTTGLAPMVSMVGCSNPSKPEEETKFTTTTGQMSSATEASFQLDWANGHSLTFASDWAFATNAGTVKSVTATGGDTRPQTVSITFDTEITQADITDGKLTFTYNDLTAKKDNISATIENICITKYTPPPKQIIINLLNSIGGTVKTNSILLSSGIVYTDDVKILIDSEAEPNNGFKFAHWTDQYNNPINEGHIFSDGETITAYFETLQECFEWEINETNNQTVTLLGFSSGWEDMSEVVIPTKVFIAGDTYTVISIGDYAFYYSPSLTEIEIPESVTTIDALAFCYCSSLTEIEIPKGVTNIGDEAFEGTGLTEIEIPKGVTSIGAGVFMNCTGLETIKVNKDNTKYWSSDGLNEYNCIVETDSNILLAGCKNTIIPDDVTNIGMWSFKGCAGLTEIEIPESVTTIGMEAFINCSGLTKINIPEKVTSIDSFAFENCTGLSEITFGGTSEQYRVMQRGEDWHSGVPATQVYCAGDQQFVPIDYYV